MSKANRVLFLMIGILSILFLVTRNSILEPIVFFLVSVLVLSLVIEKFKNKEFPRFYVSTSKSIIKALINMRSFEIQLSPIG